jgi:hypothetical protein
LLGEALVTNHAGASIAGGINGIVAIGGGSSVFNAGTISSGAAAIEFGGTGDTLTLAQGSVISGNVLPAAIFSSLAGPARRRSMSARSTPPRSIGASAPSTKSTARSGR